MTAVVETDTGELVHARDRCEEIYVSLGYDASSFGDYSVTITFDSASCEINLFDYVIGVNERIRTREVWLDILFFFYFVLLWEKSGNLRYEASQCWSGQEEHESRWRISRRHTCTKNLYVLLHKRVSYCMLVIERSCLVGSMQFLRALNEFPQRTVILKW